MKIILKSKHSNIEKGGEKRMRHLRIILTLGVGVFVLATVAFLTNTWAVENVRMTKHNLSLNPDINMQGTTEVCVFCHTPHGGRTDVAGGAAPIWNRTLTNATGYNMYKSPNFDAVNVGGNTPGKPNGVSLACLSCHDGTVAFDSLINLPGSGGYQGVDGKRANYSATGSFVDQTTGTFSATASPFPNIGETVGPGTVDLSNDHPISMEIPCNKDPQFNDICTNSDLTPLGGSPPKVAYLTRFGPSALPTDIRDRLRAYPTVAGKPYLECASCHNPHDASRPTNDGGSAIDYKNSRFLRLPSWDTADGYYTDVNTRAQAQGATAGVIGDRNAGSLLCLSCHQK